MAKTIKIILVFAAVGLVTVVLLAEYKPDLFGSGMMNKVKMTLSNPWDDYRNELAVKFAPIGAAIGAALGYLNAKFLK